MSIEDGKRLWFDAEEHFYLIPDVVNLGEGPTAITTMMGVKRQVHAAEIAPFAISREEADARMKEKAGGFAELMRGVLRDAVREAPDAVAAAKARRAESVLPSHSIEEALRPHLDAFQQGLKKIAESFRVAVEEGQKAVEEGAAGTGTVGRHLSVVRGEEEEERQVGREEGSSPATSPSTTTSTSTSASTDADDGMGEARRVGAELGGALKAVQDELGKALQSPEAERLLREVSGKLQEFADQMRARRSESKPEA